MAAAASSPDLTVSASASGLGELVVSSSPLAPAANAWLAHKLTITNGGKTTVYIDDVKVSQFLGGREVLVGSDDCGYASDTPGAPVQPACQQPYRPTSLDPGKSTILTVTLWRGLAGMSPISGDRMVLSQPIRFRTDAAFTSPGGNAGATGEIVLTYRPRAN